MQFHEVGRPSEYVEDCANELCKAMAVQDGKTFIGALHLIMVEDAEGLAEVMVLPTGEQGVLRDPINLIALISVLSTFAEGIATDGFEEDEDETGADI